MQLPISQPGTGSSVVARFVTEVGTRTACINQGVSRRGSGVTACRDTHEKD